MTITISIYCHAEPELPLSEAQIVEAPLPGKDVDIGVLRLDSSSRAKKTGAQEDKSLIQNDNYYFNLLSC